MTTDPTTAQTQAANDQGQGTADQFYTRSQYYGLKGALEQQIGDWRGKHDALTSERDALRSQFADLQKQNEAMAARVKELEPFGQKAAELENNLKTLTEASARQRVLLKYPELLADETNLALVESSNLPADKLDELLGKRAGAVREQAARPNPAVGSTPPKTGSTVDVSAEALLNEATAKMRAGDRRGFEDLMSKYYDARDAKLGKFTPADPGQAPLTPPA